MGYVGLFSNFVLLLWTLFTVIMYSFPSTKPVEANSMNYVCVIYGILVLIIAGDWLARGRKSYRGQTLRHEEALERESSLEKLHGNLKHTQVEIPGAKQPKFVI